MANIAQAAVQALPAYQFITAKVRKAPKTRTGDPFPILIVSPLEEKEMPHGANTRIIERALVIAFFRYSSGFQQDTNEGDDVRAAILGAVTNLDAIKTAAVALMPDIKVVSNSIQQRQPWEYGTAADTFDINPVAVTVITREPYGS